MSKSFLKKALLGGAVAAGAAVWAIAPRSFSDKRRHYVPAVPDVWYAHRGLRSVMEGILLPVMYDVPNDPTIIRVTIDKDTVEGGEAHLEYGAVRKRYKNQTALS